MNNIPKIITGELEAPNIGTNKIFINVNGKTSKLETNQNSKIQYKLNNPFKLDIGDKVTLYQAFVNEAGLNTDTLTFQEDLEAKVKFMYYVPQQLFKNNSPTFTPGKNSEGQPGQTISVTDRNLVFSDYQDMASFPCQTFLARDASNMVNLGLTSYRDLLGAVSMPMSDTVGGDNGVPCYLFENYVPLTENKARNTASLKGGTSNTSGYVKPAYGEVTIKIPAGNYEASSLAKNITQQFNGAYIQDANNSNFLTDRLYNPESNNYAGVDTINPFGNEEGGATTRVYFSGETGDELTATNGYTLLTMKSDKGILPAPDNEIEILTAPAPIKSDFYLNPEGLELWERNTSNVELFDTYPPLNCLNYARLGVPLDGSRPVPTSASDLAEANLNVLTNVETEGYDAARDPYLQAYANTMLLNVNPPQLDTDLKANNAANPNRYVGTHSFTVNYSDEKQNRFSIKNLHESFKLSSVTTDGAASTFGGQQATKYNCNNSFPMVNYPIEASMGIMVTNFGYEQCENTKLYEDLNRELVSVGAIYGKGSRRYLTREYELKTKKFKDFFNTEQEARAAWNKTLWSRLGFSYEQFGDIDQNIETVKTWQPFLGNPADAPSLPTPERLDKYNFGTRKLKGIITHNSFDFSDIMACANLGSSPVTIGNANVNQYDSVSFSRDKLEPLSVIGTINQDNKTVNYGLVQRNEFTVISDSQDIDAANLPDLNAGNSYYLITSDLVKPNGLDANGDPMNLLGIMSKENSSNDTLFSVDGIPNIITESKLVSELSIEIRNADNTLVPDSIIGKASGFILMIEKAINPNTMAIKSI